ncbi:Chitin synthase, class 3 [Allomyces arbusculus]|nr:Chitin synthase, class 3 [Allomyces arbusculus]
MPSRPLPPTAGDGYADGYGDAAHNVWSDAPPPLRSSPTAPPPSQARPDERVPLATFDSGINNHSNNMYAPPISNPPGNTNPYASPPPTAMHASPHAMHHPSPQRYLVHPKSNGAGNGVVAPLDKPGTPLLGSPHAIPPHLSPQSQQQQNQRQSRGSGGSAWKSLSRVMGLGGASSSSASPTSPGTSRQAEAGATASGRTTFGRKKSLVRRDRAPRRNSHHHQVLFDTSAAAGGARGNPGGGEGPMYISRGPMTLPRGNFEKPQTRCRQVWVLFARIITFYIPSAALEMAGMHDAEIQLAWREKMALCSISVMFMAIVAFLTFGFNAVLCVPQPTRMNADSVETGFVAMNGIALDVSTFSHAYGGRPALSFDKFLARGQDLASRDVSLLFQPAYGAVPECKALFGHQNIAPEDYLFPCTVPGSDMKDLFGGEYDKSHCHGPPAVIADTVHVFSANHLRRDLYITWDALHDPRNKYFAFNGDVVDLNRLLLLNKKIEDWSNVNGIDMRVLMQRVLNKDASYYLVSNATLRDAATCLAKVARIGALDVATVGCIASDVMLIVSLVVILGLIMSRFIMAALFRWFLAPKLGRKLSPDEKNEYIRMRFASMRREKLAAHAYAQSIKSSSMSVLTAQGTPLAQSFSLVDNNSAGGVRRASSESSSATTLPGYSVMPNMPSMMPPDSPFTADPDSVLAEIPDPDFNAEEAMHMILLVTCYSEGEAGIRTTLDSLAATEYLDSHKLLFVIADGIITGAGESMSTPDIIVNMMEKDPAFPADAKPYSYVAIAEGAKRHNMAKVHAGYYVYEGRRVPMVCVVKCGTPDEQGGAKPGNRGKRDSQVVLMSFLQKVMFDERMTPLEYDLYQKIHRITKVTPDNYETVTMVDADTKVSPDCIQRMVACFARDPSVMGLCGETQIDNKWGSWVTMIQVFEYYISHHLAKGFESVFGGVTCLPGCFCAYRIKTPKRMTTDPNIPADRRGGHWVPVLANPDVVEEYSENVVDTLHKKNLLLLGEDRYLTTLMMRSFPKRKMVFVPQATCQTFVPDEFKVLLSQRRRWINSTIHNLMELVLVRDLCGTFCISMQFVIAMELVGTVVLPAAITFTLYLVVISFFTTPVPVIPLLLLAAILGLPGLLILITTREVEYIFWMLIYLIALPIWNFVLPAYAFWHFDDFSWGATRVVAGASGKDAHGGAEGEFDSSQIVMKRYHEWEQIRKRAIAQAAQAAQQQAQQQAQAQQQQRSQYYGVPNTLLRGGVATDFDGVAMPPAMPSALPPQLPPVQYELP